MRPIAKPAIAFFLLLLALIVVLGIASSKAIVDRIGLGDFRSLGILALAIVAIYVYAIAAYRLALLAFPLAEGPVEAGSARAFGADVYFLFLLVLFNPLIRTHFLPAPLMRIIYIALGARFGRNTYSVGAILDPPLTQLGDDCIIGHDAVLFSHVIEGGHLAFAAIRIGDNVTVGAKATIMPGVTIGERAIVSAGAVVTKGSWIGPGERWAGVPAKRLAADRRDAETAAAP